MSENLVKTFFDNTDNYLHKKFGVRIRADIARHLVSPLDARILDIGCGDGGVTTQFLKKNVVVFLDVSKNMLALLEGRLSRSEVTNSELINSSFNEFHPKQKFDYVFAFGVLAHLPSLVAFFEHLSNDIVGKRSVVLLQFSDGESWLTRLNLIRSNRHRYKLNRIVPRELKVMLERYGFSLEAEVKYGLVLPGMGILPDEFVYQYSKFIWKSGLGKVAGTERIWKLRYLK